MTWTELRRYSGGYELGSPATMDKTDDTHIDSNRDYRGGYEPASPAAQAIESPEWWDAGWEEVEINLAAYTGPVRLRFSLEVDDQGTDRGWVIDDVIVKSGH